MGDLIVAPCGHAAAKYAVTRWHYSRAMPASKAVRYGVWEAGRFVGVVIYSRGGTPVLGAPYGLGQTECCELTRVAMRSHAAPVSEIVAVSLRALRTSNPGLRLVVSFADPVRGHHGGIYQAGNWIYTGAMVHKDYLVVRGEVMHPRSVGSAGWRQSLPWLREHVDSHAATTQRPGKHRYVMPLDKQTRRRVAKLAQPYPHAVEASEATRPGTTGEGPVRSRATALNVEQGGLTHA